MRQVLQAEDGWLLKGDSLHARDMMNMCLVCEKERNVLLHDQLQPMIKSKYLTSHRLMSERVQSKIDITMIFDLWKYLPLENIRR